MLRASIIALLAIATPQGEEAELRRLGAAGAAAFDAGDYATALDAYQRAETVLRRRDDLRSEFGLVYFLLGATYEKLDDLSNAIRAYDEALALPIPDDLRTRVERRRAAAESRFPSKLIVECDLPAAVVRIEGRDDAGACDGTWSLAPGLHTVVVSIGGWQSVKKVHVRARARQRLRIDPPLPTVDLSAEDPSVATVEATPTLLIPWSLSAASIATLVGAAVAFGLGLAHGRAAGREFQLAQDESLPFETREAALRSTMLLDDSRDRGVIAGWSLTGAAALLAIGAAWAWLAQSD